MEGKGLKVASWVLAVVASVIYVITLFFKFTAAPESVRLFTRLAGPEMEGLMRVGTGVMELITSILLLIPKSRPFGALVSLGVISGAILSHLFVLGIVVEDDGGALFLMACIIFTCSPGLLFLHRNSFLSLLNKGT
ncbi:MAG: hypothetical protein R2684_09890 [Pyrinomonadaceae bacterium]